MKKSHDNLSVLNFLYLTVAGFVNATGVTLFLTPLKLFDSGFSGTSFLLSEVTPLSLSLWLIIINFPFYIFGYKKLGLKFVIRSLYAIAMYSFFAFLYQSVFKIDFSLGSPIAKDDMLLAAIFGGLVSGLGSGITIRCGGALDGVEVMAVIFSKKLNLTVGNFVMAYNVVLYLLAGILFSQFTIPLYSIIAYAVGLKSVDFVVEGLDKAKSAMIITSKENEVASAISETFGKGITIFKAKGYYSQTNKSAIYIAINRFQIAKLKTVVSEHDENAFVTISDVSDVLGTSLKLEPIVRLGKKKKPQDASVVQIECENDIDKTTNDIVSENNNENKNQGDSNVEV